MSYELLSLQLDVQRAMWQLWEVNERLRKLLPKPRRQCPSTSRCPACGRRIISFPLFGCDLGFEWVCRECSIWLSKIRAWAKMPRRPRRPRRRR